MLRPSSLVDRSLLERLENQPMITLAGLRNENRDCCRFGSTHHCRKWKLERLVYHKDSRAIGANCISKCEIPGRSAANRVTQNYFDSRDRLVALKTGVR